MIMKKEKKTLEDTTESFVCKKLYLILHLKKILRKVSNIVVF